MRLEIHEPMASTLGVLLGLDDDVVIIDCACGRTYMTRGNVDKAIRWHAKTQLSWIKWRSLICKTLWHRPVFLAPVPVFCSRCGKYWKSTGSGKWV